MENVPARIKSFYQSAGMLAFMTISFGQLVSILGSTMSAFALTIWAWQVTGQATTLALVTFATFAPSILVSPLAGALIDRWNRKLVLIVSDLATGCLTIMLLLLYTTGNLAIWHLYVISAGTSVFQAFQVPAYAAVIPTMLPKAQYSRANGIMSLAGSIPGIAAPLLAGVLIISIGLQGILLIDIVTFLFAILTLLWIHIPQPKVSAAGALSKASLWQESLYGFRYLSTYPSLQGLLLMGALMNACLTFGNVVLSPMVLARTNSNAAILGIVEAGFGIGGVCGGLLLTVWGGPRRKIIGMLLGIIVAGLSNVLFSLGSGVYLWTTAAFLMIFVAPIVNGLSHTLWQSKVPPDVQGRVFTVRRMINQSMIPVVTLLAGSFADRVFEPAMRANGRLAKLFGGWFGVGPGAGFALMICLSGVGLVLVGIGAYASRVVREIETLLPDHDEVENGSGA